jgi:hypothetical protein
MTLLSHFDSNPKVAKNTKLGWGTAVLHLAPANMSGYQVCSARSPGCEAACLHYAGGAHLQSLKDRSRIAKTKFFFENKEAFMAQLLKEITAHVRKMDRMGLKPAVRLNATSDIPWERVRGNPIEALPEVQFYDYTAIPNRQVPDNYHLTFSLKETNESQSRIALALGLNLAVVFPTSELPDTFWGVPVIDGDENDFRPGDPTPCIVGLKAKGKKGINDTSGFIIRKAA